MQLIFLPFNYFISSLEVRRYSTWSQWLALGGNTEIRYRASCGVEVPDPMSIKVRITHSMIELLRYICVLTKIS